MKINFKNIYLLLSESNISDGKTDLRIFLFIFLYTALQI